MVILYRFHFWHLTITEGLAVCAVILYESMYIGSPEVTKQEILSQLSAPCTNPNGIITQ